MAAGKLTTHVLDTATGKPAARMQIILFAVGDSGLNEIKRVQTNSDGRCDEPLLSAEDFAIGTYELHFFAGDYLRATANQLPEPAFLDIVPIRFGISDSDSHYHVPLLISPYGYSTYRGS